MSVTLKQLGHLAGVHPSTVARVLNDDPRQRVSEDVRQRILALAAEHGYQPNHLARSLRTKRSHVVGTLIPDIANPFFALIFRGIEDALAEHDVSVILANTDDESFARGARCGDAARSAGGRVDPRDGQAPRSRDRAADGASAFRWCWSIATPIR